MIPKGMHYKRELVIGNFLCSNKNVMLKKEIKRNLEDFFKNSEKIMKGGRRLLWQ